MSDPTATDTSSSAAPAPSAAPSPAPAPSAGAPAPSPAPSAAPSSAPAPSAAPAPDAAATGEWPADWRKRIAGEDEKVIRQLERFASPKALADSYRELSGKLSRGELRAPLAKDATPEQVTEWRKANGIPETPDKYDLTLADGTVIGEADKPAVNAVVAAMHAEHATPAQVKATLATYFKFRETETQRLQEQDVAHTDETAAALRDEWGGEYRKNVNIVKSFIESAPDGVGEKLLSARTTDGRALANDPSVIRWLNSLAREINPAASVVPGSGDQAKAMNDEIAQIESLMGDRESKYWKGPTANQMQARYRELISTREKLARR